MGGKGWGWKRKRSELVAKAHSRDIRHSSYADFSGYNMFTRVPEYTIDFKRLRFNQRIAVPYIFLLANVEPPRICAFGFIAFI